MKRCLMLVVMFLVMAGKVEAYRVGVDYHSTDADFSKSAFITRYHLPEVRNLVKTQLQGMVDSGATVINTRIWVTDIASQRFPTMPERSGFPMSDQELANLRQYAKDVSSIKTASGKYLDLYLTLLWNGCGSYVSLGDFGSCNYSWEQYSTLAKKTIDGFFAATGDLTRPDGKKAVVLAYFDGENMMVKKNDDKMLLDVYPYFVDKARAAGVEPTIYFSSLGIEKEVLGNQYGVDGDFKDADYPALNGHQSMYWVYRTTEFMRKNNLFVPPRIDISFYPQPDKKSFADLIAIVAKDLRAVYPDKTYAVAETLYPTDVVRRRALGQAYASNGFDEVLFWTTPDSDGWGVQAGYPFDIDSYYLANQNPNCVNLYYQRNDATWGTTTNKYHVDSRLDCDGSGRSCSENLNLFLSGQTKGVCTVTMEVDGSDYNKDGKTDLVDFSVWKNKYLAGQSTLVEFTVWKKAYLGK